MAGGHSGPHGSTQTPVRGATWRGGWRVKGPWVRGPWLGDWGGNAFALPRPTLYTHLSPFFIPCGTMFPRNLPFAGDVAAQWALDEIAMHPSRGRRVHRIN